MTENNMPYLFERAKSKGVVNPLNKYAANNFSQDGEDGIIERIFEIISAKNKYFVEFGAWDGKYLSNCYYLASFKTWSGCFIEANPQKYNELINTHGNNEKINCVNKFVGFEGENSLENILKSVEAPMDLDLLSIDVDGTDYFIWESLEECRPRVVVIEFNPTIPNDIVFVQEKNIQINQGCSLAALIKLGKTKGYELVCCTGWNAFFVKEKYFNLFELDSNQINDVYVPISDGRIFHGYDSSIFVYGMSKLLWSDIVLTNEDFQVLPKSLRKFSDKQS